MLCESITKESSIDNLGLSPKALALLKRCEIHTVAELISKDADALMSTHGVGVSMLKSINSKLRVYGYHLTPGKKTPFSLYIDDAETVALLREARFQSYSELKGKTVFTLAGKVKLLGDQLVRFQAALCEFGFEPIPVEAKGGLDAYVQTLGLNKAQVKELNAIGVETLADLQNLTRSEIAALKGFGEDTSHQVELGVLRAGGKLRKHEKALTYKVDADTPITKLGLNKRLMLEMQRLPMDTVGDLLSTPCHILDNVCGLNSVSLKALNARVKKYGFSLKVSKDTSFVVYMDDEVVIKQLRTKKIVSHSDLASYSEEELLEFGLVNKQQIAYLQKVFVENGLPSISQNKPLSLDDSVNVLGLTKVQRKSLYYTGINKIGDLQKLTLKDLSSLVGFGKKSAEKINLSLMEAGGRLA